MCLLGGFHFMREFWERMNQSKIDNFRFRSYGLELCIKNVKVKLNMNENGKSLFYAIVEE